MSFRKLTPNAVALAYELRKEGVSLKIVSYGLGVSLYRLCHVLSKTEREGIAWLG